MAITLDNKARLAMGSTNPHTLTMTIASGAKLAVLVCFTPNAIGSATPTLNGVAMSGGGSHYCSESYMYMWYMINPPTGSQTFSLSVAADLALVAATFIPNTAGDTFALSTSQEEKATSTYPGISTTSGPNTTPNLYVAAGADGYKNAPSAASDQSLYITDEGAYSDFAQYAVDHASTDRLEWTLASSESWVVLAFYFTEESPPAAPTSAHTDSKTNSQIVMHWTDNSSNETGFKMYKDDQYIETIAAGSVSYTFTGLNPSTQYDLAVKATGTGGDSAEAQLTETTNATVPTAPTGPYCSAKATNTVTLNWIDNATNETGYKTYKDDAYVETIAAGSTSYQFTGLSAGTKYDLAVKATNSGGDSAEAQLDEYTYTSAPSGDSYNVFINIGDTWKNASKVGAKFNVGDVWKTIVDIYINIGDTWKSANWVTLTGGRGYWAGGYFGLGGAVGSSFSTYATKDIQGIVFANDTAVYPAAQLSVGRYSGCGIHAPTKGYVLGGTNYLAVVVADIDGISFADETATNPAATLTKSLQSGAEVESTTRGYELGAVLTAAYSKEIVGIQFSDETYIDPSAVLVSTRQSGCGIQSSVKGYSAGGFNGSIHLPSMESLQFSDETVHSVSETILAQSFAAGASSATKGYIMGGSGAETYDEVQVILWSDESLVSQSTLLSTVRKYHSGIESTEKGYAVGGWEPNPGHNVVDSVRFSDDAYVAVSALLMAPNYTMVGM